MRDRTMSLADGRTLGWAEAGALGSESVVIYNHGTPSSRLEVAFNDAALRDMGISVIAPDRPGYGLSSPRRDGRSVADWADDIAPLADELGLRRFAVCGYSGGGPHALAIGAAAALADRVTRIVLLASIAEGQPTPDSERVSAQARSMSFAEFEAWYENGELPPLAEADLEALANPALAEAMMSALAEGARQGSLGGASDEYAFAQPWGFDHSAVTQPVELWQGDADTFVPVEHIDHLADALPNAHINILPGQGHISLANYMLDIFKPLAAI